MNLLKGGESVSRIPHKERIIDYIIRHGFITHKQAEYFGCRRCAARVCDLRKEGYPIQTEMISVNNRDGSTSRIAKYLLPEPDRRAILARRGSA